MVIRFSPPMALIYKSAQSFQLAQPKRSLHVGHAVVKSKLDLLVIPWSVRRMRHLIGITGNAVAAQPLHRRIEFGVFGVCFVFFVCCFVFVWLFVFFGFVVVFVFVFWFFFVFSFV